MEGVDSVKSKRKLLKEFIQLYESFPCLWRLKSREYHDRELRARAYKVLVKKLQEIQPEADRAAVVRKINCLRCNIRKEKRKTSDYLKAGRIYKTKLWYYPLFSFLNGISREPAQSETPESLANIKIEGRKDPLEWQCEIDEESNEDGNSHDKLISTEEEVNQTVYEIESPHISHTGPSKLKLANYQVDKDTRYRGPVHKDDKHDIFGKNVAMKLRHISSNSDIQRIMAEKIINQAMYMAEMGLLTMEVCKVLDKM